MVGGTGFLRQVAQLFAATRVITRDGPVLKIHGDPGLDRQGLTPQHEIAIGCARMNHDTAADGDKHKNLKNRHKMADGKKVGSGYASPMVVPGMRIRGL